MRRFLVPLAVTSTKKAVARLRYARWKRLHRLVYVVGVLAVVHFWMRVKADVREPLVWAAVLAVAFGVRAVDAAHTAWKARQRVSQ